MSTNVKSVLIIMCFSFFLKSCTSSQPQEQDFIGIWKSNDGAIIELNKDYSLVAKQVNLSNIFFDKDNRDKRIDFTGKWKFKTDYYKRKVIEINSDRYNLSFEISGQGIFENKPPWDLFIWVGDPDDMNKYKFVKQ